MKHLLRKPALQYPHAEVVNPNEKVDFQCELQSSGKIAKARLMIDDNNYEYYFDNFDIQNLQENNYSSLVTYPIKNNIPTYKIYKSDNNRTSNETTFSFAAGEMYTWKMRIYEDDTKFNEDDTKSNYVPSSWIGKGTVMEILSGAESAGSNQGTYYGLNSSEMNGNRILKINPHTQMYFKDCTLTKTSDDNPHKELWTRYDENANYYIKVGNTFAKIKKYYYFLPKYDAYKKDPERGDKTVKWFNSTDDLDTYGEPKFGYAVVSGKLKVSVNDTYTIYCNYIDTDQYYFDTNTPPTITLYENFESVNGTNVTREIDLSENTQLAPLSLSYSNLHITGEYLQSEGISVSHYSFLLERRESDTKYSTVAYSNNIYSTIINWQYDRFISGNEYRLTLSLTDSVGATYEKIIYLSTEYNSVSYPTNLKIEPYRKHNSLIIDFSELHSITENEKIKNGHQFIAYNESTDKIDTTLEIPNNSCHVDKGNSLTYDSIDGEKELSFGTNTVYTTFRVDTDYTGRIFEVTADNGIITTLDWDGIYFRIYVGTEDNNGVRLEPYSPYENWNNKTNEKKIQAINEALAKEETNYSIPYLYMDGQINYGDSVYYHTETPISEQTWLVIIDTEGKRAYFKNMSDKNSEFVERKWGVY